VQARQVIRPTQVEHDAALSPQPQRAGRERPEPVTAGRLDLDHLGAEVGEHHRRHAARGPAGEVDDAEALEHVGRHGLAVSG
jgi:hypothetical protein